MKPYGLSASRPDTAELLRRTRALLAADRAAEALVELRDLVYPDGSYTVDRDAPVAFRVNFAAAMLARGSLPGALTALADPVARAHPAARRLLEQLEDWRRDLGFWQRLSYRLYGTASRPLPRWDFPGLLLEPAGPPLSRAA